MNEYIFYRLSFTFERQMIFDPDWLFYFLLFICSIRFECGLKLHTNTSALLNSNVKKKRLLGFHAHIQQFLGSPMQKARSYRLIAVAFVVNPPMRTGPYSTHSAHPGLCPPILTWIIPA